MMRGKNFFVDRYRQLGWEFNETEPRKAIRINNVNARGKNLEKRLKNSGLHLTKIPFLNSGYWVLDSKVSVGATAEYLLGLYSIQEAAAQIPVTLFSNLNGKNVLDACAAPGGKTIQLADLMYKTGIILALDIKKRRLAALCNNLERCHVSNTVVYNLDARQASKLGLTFDRILLDVPCSGNFSIDKSWFERRTLIDIKRNAKFQREILIHAAICLRPDGEIIYSTCSLEPEENELNMNWALENLNLQIQEIDCQGQKGLTQVFGSQLDDSVARCRRLWPSETQGFFVCKLKMEAEN